MYEKINTCPICTAKKFTNHIICNDYVVSNEKFTIVQCQICGLLITNPRPNKISISSYYQSENYISHTNVAHNLINTIYKWARKYTCNQKFNIIKKLKTNHSILDYGCGTGHLLNHFTNKGWKTIGVEPNNNARKIANQKETVVSAIDKLPKEKYAIISLWHVLEHLHYINETIEQLTTLLAPNGKFVIAIPNTDSLDQKIYQQYWAAYDTPRHLFHFNQLTMKKLMKYHKLKLMAIHPMKLDAYYVSMLSEKYKTGTTNYLKSIVNGYKSNNWAKKNNNNYSSLIYIFAKK